MFVDDLFDKKTLTENRGGGSPWHSEPEQQQMDVNRRGGLERERNAGLDEPDDAVSSPAQTGNGVYEYTVPAGQEDIAQELGLQQHRGHWVSRVPIQRANFQFGRPQFHEIPSQGVAEAATPASTSKVLRLIQRHHSDWFDTYGIGEVEDAVVDMAEMGQFQGMSAEDAVALVAQELDSLYGAQGMAEGLMSKKQLQAQQAQINHLIRQGYELDPKDNRWRKPKNNNTEPKKKEQGVAEGTQVNELFGFGQDLQKQIAKKEDELKALKAKLASKTATNAGIQTGATALIDPETNQPYEKDKLASLYGYKEPSVTPAAPTTSTVATSPAGFNAGNVMKLPGMEKYAKPAAPAKTANFAGPSGYGKTTTSIKAPAAPRSPALAVPKAPAAPTAPRVTSGGPTPAEKAALDKRIAAAAAAPAVAETIAQVERMLESVTSKKSADMIRAYVDQKFTELGLRNTTECRNLMTHVVQESAIRRRQHAKSLAK